jgi:predicted DCC family thiol-disulfide oxidoreductase YuxK
MKHIYAFYDGACGLCQQCRTMLTKEGQIIPVIFLPYQSLDALHLCPVLYSLEPHRQIVAMTDTGDIYQGERAWLLLLWATHRWRDLSYTLAGPMFRGLVTKAVELISKNRLGISRVLKLFLLRQFGTKGPTEQFMPNSLALRATLPAPPAGID